MARLWSEIAGNYFVNLHGETTARLSRNQRLLPLPDVDITGVIVVIKKMLLGAADRYYNSLCELWVDKITYAAHWRLFMISTLKDWRQIALWAMMLLISSFGIFGVSMTLKAPSPILVSFVQSSSLITVLFCLISISTSLVLLRTYSNHSEAHASEAVDFLENSFHPKYGLQPLAILFSLPWASFVWAFMCFTICILLLSFSIDFLAFRVFIWATVFIALIAGYTAYLFLKNGAVALNGTRLRATLPVSGGSLSIMIAGPRLVIRKMKTGVDSVGRVFSRILRQVRSRRTPIESYEEA